MHGTCGWWGTWEPTHTGMPSRGLDGIWGGGPLADSSSQIVATHLTRFLWLDHAFSCLGQGALASQGRRSANSKPGQEEGEGVHNITLV